MEPIADVINRLRGARGTKSPSSRSAQSYEDYAKEQVKQANSIKGDLTGYDCKLCLNRGYITVLEDGEPRIQLCRCQQVRRSIRLMEQSGINPEYTLENFKAESDWQKQLLSAAWFYLRTPAEWFYLGGQVGAGKTHICTGIVRKFLERGIAARYMLWRDDAVTIKASVKDAEAYAELVEPLKTIPVLYIDDFLKTTSGEPTTADLNLAFEIINARYNRRELLTLISSEFMLHELADLDEAVASRIVERTSKFRCDIGRDRSKNYRFRGLTK